MAIEFKMCPKCLKGAIRPTGEVVKLLKNDSGEDIVGDVSECDTCHYLVIFRQLAKKIKNK
jgi:hypothetical protein